MSAWITSLPAIKDSEASKEKSNFAGLDVLEQQPLHLRISLLNVVTRLGALSVGMLMGSPRIMLALFACSGVLMYGYYCLAILNSAGVLPRKVLPVVITSVVRLIPAAAAIIVLKAFGSPSILVVVAAAMMVLVYYIHVLRTDPAARQFINTRFSRPEIKAADMPSAETHPA